MIVLFEWMNNNADMDSEAFSNLLVDKAIELGMFKFGDITNSQSEYNPKFVLYSGTYNNVELSHQGEQYAISIDSQLGYFFNTVEFIEATQSNLTVQGRVQSVRRKIMAFETLFMTNEEKENVKDKYELCNKPFRVYRYDKVNNVYLYLLSFGSDLDHPGHFMLIWDEMVCKMAAHPTEWLNMTNSNPEKSFLIYSIDVSECFNKDKEMLIDLLEQAFFDFVVQVKGTILYIFKIIIN